MKELIKFELLKARYNTLYVSILVIMVVILFLAMLFSINSFHETYVFRQHDNAKTVMNRSDNLSEDVLDCYREIITKDSWQEIYEIYNKIDNLNEGAKTDLDFGTQTNIEYRNYQLKYQIPPESNTSGIWLINIYKYFLKYILIGIFIIIGLNILLIEYQEHTDNYLFCLNYCYRKIFLSKFIVTLLIVLITAILPMILFYLIYSLTMGFSNPHAIFEYNLFFHDVVINNYSFMTINILLISRLIEIIIYYLIINIIVFVSIYLIKINPPNIINTLISKRFGKF